MSLEGIDPVVVNFAIKGLPDVERALDRLSTIIRKAENTNSKAHVDGAKTRVKATKDAIEEEAKAAEAAVKRQEKADKQLTKSVESEAKKQRVAREREIAQLVRENDMAEKKMANNAIREAKRASSAIEQEHRRRANIMMGSLSGTLSKGGMLIGAAAGIGGGFALADIVKKQFAAEKSAALLVNAVTTGNKPPEGANVANIMAQASKVSVETGMDKGEIVAASLEYARSAKGGDYGGIMANMGFFAKMANVTGASMSDITSAAGTLQSQNQNLSSEDMQGLIMSAYAQSKEGSLSLVDSAKQVGNITSTRGAFAGNAGENQLKLMALAQIGAPEGEKGSVGVYVKNIAEEAMKKRADALKSGDSSKLLGINFTKTGQIESIEQMISAVMKSTKGDLGKIEGTFGARGSKVFTGLSADYRRAKENGATDAQAVTAALDAYKRVAEASMSLAQVEEQNAQVMGTTGARVEQSFTKIRETLANSLDKPLADFANNTLPALVPKIIKLAEAAGSVAEFFIKDPGLGIGAAMAGAVVKDIASAEIGRLMGAALGVAAAKAGGDSVAIASATKAYSAINTLGGGAMAVATQFAALAAVAAVAVGATMSLVKWLSDKDVESQGAAVGGATDLGNITRRIQAGIATPGEIERGEKLAKEREEDAKTRGNGLGMTDLMAGQITEWVTGDNVAVDREHSQKKMADQERAEVKHFRDMVSALDRTTKALENSAAKGLSFNMVPGTGQPTKPKLSGSVNPIVENWVLAP